MTDDDKAALAAIAGLMLSIWAQVSISILIIAARHPNDVRVDFTFLLVCVVWGAASATRRIITYLYVRGGE